MLSDLYVYFREFLIYVSLISLHRMGVNWAMPVLGYGQAWRKSRKMFHHYFIMNGGRTFQGMQLDGTRRFLSNLHIDPQNFLAHTRQ